MVMVDIDRFKSINDIFGYDKGDIILINVLKLISDFISEDDIVVCWGGEEFLLIFININE